MRARLALIVISIPAVTLPTVSATAQVPSRQPHVYAGVGITASSFDDRSGSGPELEVGVNVLEWAGYRVGFAAVYAREDAEFNPFAACRHYDDFCWGSASRSERLSLGGTLMLTVRDGERFDLYLEPVGVAVSYRRLTRWETQGPPTFCFANGEIVDCPHVPIETFEDARSAVGGEIRTGVGVATWMGPLHLALRGRLGYLVDWLEGSGMASLAVVVGW